MTYNIIYKDLSALGVRKQRSEETHKEIHEPQLSTAINAYRRVLIGDSMLERLYPGNYEYCLPENSPPTFEEPLINLGVGGDKIRNVIYRMSTLGALAGLQKVGLTENARVIMHMGTNDLTPKRGLRKQEIDSYIALIRAIRSKLGNHFQVVVTGLFQRTDVSAEIVAASNRLLEKMVSDFEDEGIAYLKPCGEIVPTREFLVDHVHMNGKGYALWLETLIPGDTL